MKPLFTAPTRMKQPTRSARRQAVGLHTNFPNHPDISPVPGPNESKDSAGHKNPAHATPFHSPPSRPRLHAMNPSPTPSSSIKNPSMSTIHHGRNTPRTNIIHHHSSPFPLARPYPSPTPSHATPFTHLHTNHVESATCQGGMGNEQGRTYMAESNEGGHLFSTTTSHCTALHLHQPICTDTPRLNPINSCLSPIVHERERVGSFVCMHSEEAGRLRHLSVLIEQRLRREPGLAPGL